MPRRGRGQGRGPGRGGGWEQDPAAPGQAETVLGELEAAIMRHCWARAEVAGTLDGAPQTVADVHQALAAAGRRSAYTTVMTVMGRLVEKGLLWRSAGLGRSGPGSSYRYWPAQNEADFIAAASHERISALIETFGDVALAQFADALSALDPERLAALAQLSQHLPAIQTAGMATSPGPAASTQTNESIHGSAGGASSVPHPDQGTADRATDTGTGLPQHGVEGGQS